jgi:hypothetical protein
LRLPDRVIPANAGIQGVPSGPARLPWTPAFAGETRGSDLADSALPQSWGRSYRSAAGLSLYDGPNTVPIQSVPSFDWKSLKGWLSLAVAASRSETW